MAEGGDNHAAALLKQIEGLLRQYINLGASTPLYSEAQSFLSDVQHASSQGEPETPAEDTAEGGIEEPPAHESGGDASPPSDFRSATKAAMSDHAEHGNFGRPSGGAKGQEPQPPDEAQQRRRRSKAS